MLLEHVERVKLRCFKKEDWLMELVLQSVQNWCYSAFRTGATEHSELVLQSVQKGREFFQETAIIIMTEKYIIVCLRDIRMASSLSFACGLYCDC